MTKRDRFSIVEEGVALWPPEYLSKTLAPDHCADVLRGSYDIPWWPSEPPVILDIGANVGAFVRWAVKRWPGCTLHAYEPEPGNFKLLLETVRTLGLKECIHIRNQAVDREAKFATLANYAWNCGEFSLYKQETGREPSGAVEVEVIAAASLPIADIIKIDAEGSETAIIPALAASGALAHVSAVMFEYHNADDGLNLRIGLELNGFELVGENILAPHRGELQFMRKTLLQKLYPDA